MDKKVIELKIDDIDFSNVQAIALVDFPAIEENFMKFNKEKNYTFAKQNTERMEVTGPAMVPNKEIYRFDFWTGEEYFVKFSEETVRECAQLFLKQFRQNNVNLQHSINANGIVVVESWIIEDPKNDKSTALGFNLPKGTWMITMSLKDNPTVWDMVKNEELRGFSIEGYFTEEVLEASLQEEFCQLVEKLKDIDEAKKQKVRELFKDFFVQK